jgi:Predicted permeases
LIKKLDRYILLEYLKVFVVLMIGVIMIYVVVNFFEMTDKIADNKPSPTSIVRYYLWQIPYLLSLLMPIAALLACFFSIGEMNRRMEIIALKASGLDIYRAFVPILFVGLVNSIIGIYLNWELVPKGRLRAAEIKAFEIEKRKDLPASTFANNLLFFGKGNRLYFFGYINSKDNYAQGINIFQFDERGEIKGRIEAVRATFDGKFWKLEGVKVREFKGYDETIKNFPSLVDTLIRETPSEFLKPLGDSLMTIPELMKRIKFLKGAKLVSWEEETELAIRFLFPIMNIIILFIGLPLSVFSGVRGGGRALAFGSSMFLAFFYWGALQSARAFGETGRIDPWLSALIPNFLFLLLSIPLILKVHR